MIFVPVDWRAAEHILRFRYRSKFWRWRARSRRASLIIAVVLVAVYYGIQSAEGRAKNVVLFALWLQAAGFELLDKRLGLSDGSIFDPLQSLDIFFASIALDLQQCNCGAQGDCVEILRLLNWLGRRLRYKLDSGRRDDAISLIGGRQLCDCGDWCYWRHWRTRRRVGDMTVGC